MIDYKKIKKSLKKALKAIEQMEMLDILMRTQAAGHLPPNTFQLFSQEFAKVSQSLNQATHSATLPSSSAAPSENALPPMSYQEWLKKLADRQSTSPSVAPAPSPLSTAGADEALRQSEQRLRTIIDSTPLGIVITNEDGIIEYANQAYCDIYGYTAQEMIGKPFTIVVPPEKKDFWMDLHRKYLDGYKEIRGEWEVRHKSGRPIYILADAARIIGTDGKRKKVTFVSDITEMIKLKEEARQSELQLLQAEKMSSLGQMVAGLAHEMNTPLGFVRNNLELLESKHLEIRELLNAYDKLRTQIMYGTPNDVAMMLAQIDQLSQKVKNRVYEQAPSLYRNSIEGIDRIQDLILNLKNFSRLDEASFKPTNVNESIESTLKIANHLFKGGIQVIKEFSPLPDIMAYPAQLNQVFLNLITNAVQAVDERNGRIVIRTMQQGDNVVIKIADNGKGIPPEHLKRIFEPFFTTKDVGQGTGLGLSIAYRIIEKHKGKIDVQSQVGKGTEFTIQLPINPMQTTAKSTSSPFVESPFLE
jgi:PAS domain S-box-containing protein